MMIIALKGKPGSGKTRYYHNNLIQFPLFDVSKVYEELQGIDGKIAFTETLSRLHEALHEFDIVVIEATFFENSYQCAWLEAFAIAVGARLRYIDLDEKAPICIQRVKNQTKIELADANNETERRLILARYQARMKILTGDWQEKEVPLPEKMDMMKGDW